MNKQPDPLTSAGLLADFRLLVYLFVGFRLILGMVFQPYLFDLVDRNGRPVQVERGMSTFGDLHYYYQFTRLSEDGIWPYRDYWFEFPPVWITLLLGVYQVMHVRGAADFTGWATTVGLILLIFDVGNLFLIRRLARRLHGDQAAVALPWIYALLIAPVIFLWWTFETLVVFWMLLALLWLLEGQDRRSAVVAALGTLTKYTSILILPAVWRFYDRRRAVQYTLITLVIVGVVCGLLIGWGGRMAVGSLLAQWNKASYQSIWALLDGNRGTGSFPGLETRFDADQAFKLYGNQPMIPSWLRLIPFAGLGLVVFTRKLRQDDQGIAAFFTLTLVLFFLWSQGWSPQWTLTLSPLILLNFPNREGVLLCLVLAFASFVEYPLLFMRAGDTAGAISGSSVPLYVVTILSRTVILIGLAGGLYHGLTRGAGDEKA